MQSDGSGFTGWAMLGGIPGTIAGFMISPAFGLAALAATVAAFWYGHQQQQSADQQRRDEEHTRERQAREQAQQAQRDLLQSKYDALHDAYEAGLIDKATFDREGDKILDQF